MLLLPRDMKLEVLSHLESRDLCELSLVSKDIKDLTKSDFIWKYKIIKYDSDKNSYYEKYKYSYGLEKVEKWLRKYTFFDDLLKITHINLSSLQLYKIPVELGTLYNIESLWFNNINLKEIPAELGNLSNLRYLQLSNNKLEEIPVKLCNLANLRQLILYCNKIKKIPTELGHLYNLHILDLHGNELTEIPVELGNLFHLQHLDLKNNQLKEIPAAVTALNCNIIL